MMAVKTGPKWADWRKKLEMSLKEIREREESEVIPRFLVCAIEGYWY